MTTADATSAPAVTVQSGADADAGALIDGRYRVVRVLGQGGMGVVVEAEHLRLSERVAIKILSSNLVGSEEARARFEREARAAVKLKGPHVGQVRDIGELASGQPFLVMELLAGTDLAAQLADQAWPEASIVKVVLQTCEALAEAHAAGIVHRDIKPANLFITDVDGEPHVKVLDFGVASLPTNNETKLTRDGYIIGTPDYMSPAQMQGQTSPAPAWDIWALGVVLYEATERAMPFAGDSFAKLVVEVMTAPMRVPQRMSPALRKIIETCLDRNGAGFLNVYELAVALAPLCDDERQRTTSLARIARALSLDAPAVGRVPSKPVAAVTAVTAVTATLDAQSGETPSALAPGAAMAQSDTLLAPELGRTATPNLDDDLDDVGGGGARAPRRWPWLMLAGGLLIAVAATILVQQRSAQQQRAVVQGADAVTMPSLVGGSPDAAPSRVAAPVDAAVDAVIDAAVDAPADANVGAATNAAAPDGAPSTRPATLKPKKDLPPSKPGAGSGRGVGTGSAGELTEDEQMGPRT